MAGKLPKRKVKGRSYFKHERDYLDHLLSVNINKHERRVHNTSPEMVRYRSMCKKYAQIFSLNINTLPPRPETKVTFQLYVDDMGPAPKYPMSQMAFLRGVDTCFIRNDELSSLPLGRKGLMTFNTLGHAISLTNHDRLMYTGMAAM